MPSTQAYKSALEWQLDQGIDEALNDSPRQPEAKKEAPAAPPESAPVHDLPLPQKRAPAAPVILDAPVFLGKSDARAESEKLASAATTLDELRESIKSFDGISLKKTATNLVFSDGNPKAPIMLVGEAPGADEDRLGKPFVGVSGQLLDRIFKCIGLDRLEADPTKSVYIANILNWRPPGNRNPSPAEIEVSLPFIEKHIALVQPKLLILCGGISAKSLLYTEVSVSKLRNRWHHYTPRSEFLRGTPSIPAIATYHPAYLLRTPSQKKAVWQDMLALQAKSLELGNKS